jgi:hypothetical protein
MRSIGVVVLWIIAFLGVAEAADIEVQRFDNGSALVVVEGRFELSDVEAFRENVEALPAGRATVAFRSRGGRLLAGIRIGAVIRAKKFTTVVPDGASCASACALAWLGGVRRLVGQDSSVGFHAAFVYRPDGPTESGPGNAILGAYLNQLGLSEKAILYITQAAPTTMQWMSLQDAAENGIAVATLPPLRAAAHADAAASIVERDNPERRATEFVRELVARSSGRGDEVLPFLENLYAEKVVYNGKSTPREAVLLSKHRLADRWTERVYTIKPGSLSATCRKTGETCRVKGVMTWKYFNDKTRRRSRGAAHFEYGVVLAGDVPQIVAETSSVRPKSPASPNPFKKIKRDFQQLLARVSKLVQ